MGAFYSYGFVRVFFYVRLSVWTVMCVQSPTINTLMLNKSSAYIEWFLFLFSFSSVFFSVGENLSPAVATHFSLEFERDHKPSDCRPDLVPTSIEFFAYTYLFLFYLFKNGLNFFRSFFFFRLLVADFVSRLMREHTRSCDIRSFVGGLRFIAICNSDQIQLL